MFIMLFSDLAQIDYLKPVFDVTISYSVQLTVILIQHNITTAVSSRVLQTVQTSPSIKAKKTFEQQ